MGVKYTSTHDRMHAAEGTITVMILMNCEEWDLNAPDDEIAKRMIPHENLSRRLYIPNTIAPSFPLFPITSEMRLIPVDKVIDWAIPTNRATI